MGLERVGYGPAAALLLYVSHLHSFIFAFYCDYVIPLLPDFPSPVGQQPAVHAGGVEEVEAGESPHHVPRQEVRQADHAVGAGLLHTPALARGSDSDHS